MSRTFRHDRGELPRPVRRPDGSIVFSAHVARTGRHVYTHGDEHRDRAELERIVGQLAGKPITVDHDGFCRAGACTIVGRVERAWLDGDHAAAELRIDDPRVVDLIAAGKREVSLGYFAEVVDGWQRNIDIDHVSIVDVGRCGPTCAIRADSNQEKDMASCGCIDEGLVEAAKQVGVRVDEFDGNERELALATLRAAGVDVSRPYVSSRTIAVQDEHPLYIRELAKSAVKFRERWGRDAFSFQREDGERDLRFRTDEDRRIDALRADVRWRAKRLALRDKFAYVQDDEQRELLIDSALLEEAERERDQARQDAAAAREWARFDHSEYLKRRERQYQEYAAAVRDAWKHSDEEILQKAAAKLGVRTDGGRRTMATAVITSLRPDLYNKTKTMGDSALVRLAAQLADEKESNR